MGKICDAGNARTRERRLGDEEGQVRRVAFPVCLVERVKSDCRYLLLAQVLSHQGVQRG